MKNIIYNNDNLKEQEINNIVRRAKAIIINSNDEILFAHTQDNYFFVGGRVDDNENFEEGLVREIKEETGIDIPLTKRDVFCTITYMNKDYPKEGINTKSIANYYVIKCDIKPDLSKVKLTEEEKYCDFCLEYISKKNVLNELHNHFKKCTKKNVVRDTIKVIKEYVYEKYN
jgi:8-oxo-dGTP pyrophosphatase MutT (NUDIX family)